MIEIENYRLYIDGIFKCYAAHTLRHPFDGHCYVSYSYRHGRNLVSVGGEAWMGDRNGTLPDPDVVIGSVVSLDGLLPDAGAMVMVTEYLQTRTNVRIKVS